MNLKVVDVFEYMDEFGTISADVTARTDNSIPGTQLTLLKK